MDLLDKMRSMSASIGAAEAEVKRLGALHGTALPIHPDLRAAEKQHYELRRERNLLVKEALDLMPLASIQHYLNLRRLRMAHAQVESKVS